MRGAHHINMFSQPVIFSSASLRLHLSKLFCHSFPLYNISCHLFYFHPLPHVRINTLGYNYNPVHTDIYGTYRPGGGRKS